MYNRLILSIYICFLVGCIEKKVTFYKDIAPIIHENCTPCHRSGQSAPFNLITYKDIAKRSKMIKYVTETGYMPPWPADPNYSNFIGEKYLNKSEINLIKEWIKQGKIKGDSNLLSTPNYPKISQLSKPDTTIKFIDAIPITGNNKDKFYMVALPFELPKKTYIKTIEFVPDNKQIVHHVNTHIISYNDNLKEHLNNKTWYSNTEINEDTTSFKKLNLLNNDGTYPTLIPLVCNYLPGVLPIVYPKGIGGYTVGKKNILLINDLHFGPSPIDTFDKSYFNIFYDSLPPKRPLKEIQLGSLGISEIIPPLVIPPDTIMKFTTKAVVFNDISILTVNPHMHLLGKSIISFAITLTRDTIPLIKIDDWDFKWQYFYTFKNMVKIPKGSTIIVEASFDNTINNPYNPNFPPDTVSEKVNWNGKGSMRTTDEMLQFIITYLPYQNEDEKIALDSYKFN